MGHQSVGIVHYLISPTLMGKRLSSLLTFGCDVCMAQSYLKALFKALVPIFVVNFIGVGAQRMQI
jgi:hypothetical protein